MKVKKMLLALAMVASLLGTAVMPVSATRLNVTTRAEDFFVRIRGGSVLSSRSIKKGEHGRTMGYYARERTGTKIPWIHGKETVNLRGRTEGDVKCTGLVQRKTPGGGDMSYYRDFGFKGNFYKLAVQYDDDNPYQYLDLRCRWTP